MCFKSKPKVPKTNPDAIKAPDPVLIDEPKGVDFGSDDKGDDKDEADGVESLKVKRSGSDKGDGSSSETAKDTGYNSSKRTATATVKRAIKKVTK